MKDLYNMQKQAKQIKKELQKVHIQSEVDDVTVTLNGEMDIVDIKITDAAMEMGGDRVSNAIQEAFKKAKKKAESIAAEKMKALMGGGFPGLGQ